MTHNCNSSNNNNTTIQGYNYININNDNNNKIISTSGWDILFSYFSTSSICFYMLPATTTTTLSTL